MTSYLPPTENLPIFDTLVFKQNDEPLTYAEAVKLFLKYPNAQGTENLQAINVAGFASFLNNVSITGQLKVDSLLPYPTNYYVSKSGNDTTGTGSMLNPFLTIQKAITTGSASYTAFTIYIDRGTYTEDLTIGNVSVNLIGSPDWDIAGTFIIGFSGITLSGSITYTGVTSGTTCCFQNLAFVFGSGKKITYTSGSYMVFSNCHLQSTSGDNISMITSGSGYIYMVDCRLIKNVANTAPMLDLGQTGISTLSASRTEFQGRSTTALLRINGSVLFGVGMSINNNGDGTSPAILIIGTASATYQITSLTINTQATGPFIKYQMTGVVNATIRLTQSRIFYNTVLTPATNFIIENATAGSVLTLQIGGNDYLQTSGTPITQPNLYGGVGVFSFNNTLQISDIDMGLNNIINGTSVSLRDLTSTNTTGYNINSIGFNDSSIAPIIGINGPNLYLEGGGGNIILDSNNLDTSIGDVTNAFNQTKILVKDSDKSINTTASIIKQNTLTIPFCLTAKRTALNFNYNAPNSWLMVDMQNVTFPSLITDVDFANWNFKVEFTINMWNNTGPTLKGNACYIELFDGSTAFYGNTVNNVQPYTRHANASIYNATATDMLIWTWTDNINLTGITNNSVEIKLWVYSDGAFTTDFNYTYSLTRTNMI